MTTAKETLANTGEDLLERDDARLLALTKQLRDVMRSSLVLAEGVQAARVEAQQAGCGAHRSHLLVERGETRVRRIRQALEFIKGATIVLKGAP
jgi:hypothetical protein